MTPRYVIYALTLLWWLLGNFCYAQPGEPIAHICGGCALFHNGNAASHNRDLVQLAANIGAKLRENGYKRLFFHNPGGLHILAAFPVYDPKSSSDPNGIGAFWADIGRLNKTQDARTMHPNQWQLSQQAGLPWAKDADLKRFHQILMNCGVEEVIYYLGGPDVLQNPLEDGQRCVAPFLAAGEPSTVSIAFDAIGHEENGYHKTPGRMEACRELCRWLKGKGHRVYLEPRLGKKVDFWQGSIDGTIARAIYDSQRPDDYKATLAAGEVIRIPTDEAAEADIKNWPAEITPTIRKYATTKAVDVRGK